MDVHDICICHRCRYRSILRALERTWDAQSDYAKLTKGLSSESFSAISTAVGKAASAADDDERSRRAQVLAPAMVGVAASCRVHANSYLTWVQQAVSYCSRRHCRWFQCRSG